MQRSWQSAAVVVFALGVAACGSSADSGDGGTEAAIGAKFAADRGCPVCHTPPRGAAMSGDESPVAGTMAFASNLTPDRTTGLGGWADEQIIRAIRYGFDADGVAL